MNDTALRRSERTRTVLALSAWVTLAFIAFGWVLQLGGLNERWDQLSSTAPGSMLADAVLLVAGMALLTMWLAGLWHAITDPGDHLGLRLLMVATLVIGNAVAVFFYYYFLFVHWLPPHRRF